MNAGPYALGLPCHMAHSVQCRPLLGSPNPIVSVQEEGTSAGLDGLPAAGMSRAARTADEAEAASKAAEEMTPVTYNYAFFHFIFALASMYLAMLMTGNPTP